MDNLEMILMLAYTIIIIGLMNTKDREFSWNERHGYASEKHVESYARLICIVFSLDCAWLIIALYTLTLFTSLIGFGIIHWFYCLVAMIINDRISKERGCSYYKARSIEGRRRE